MQAPSPIDLWELALDRPQIDPAELAAAMELQICEVPLDVRTRLLVRDSLDALGHSWGPQKLNDWLSQSTVGEALRSIAQSTEGPPGFPSLVYRVMETTKSDTVLQFLRELGMTLKQPTRISIGGSVALILANALHRRTEEIDVVDEVPVEIRSQHELLDQLATRYALKITHFQSHYLPTGWDTRLSSLRSFGQLEVMVVDIYDIFLSKLFSARLKNRDDLRVLAPQIDKPALIQRLLDTTLAFRKDPSLTKKASDNWYILYGQPLPA